MEGRPTEVVARACTVIDRTTRSVELVRKAVVIKGRTLGRRPMLFCLLLRPINPRPSGSPHCLRHARSIEEDQNGRMSKVVPGG